MKIEHPTSKRAHLLGKSMLEKLQDQIRIERKIDKISATSNSLVLDQTETPEDQVLANDFCAISNREYSNNQVVGYNFNHNSKNNNNIFNSSPQSVMYNSTMLHHTTNKRYSSASSQYRRALVKSSSGWKSNKFLQASLVAVLVLSTFTTHALSSTNSDNESAKSSSTSSTSPLSSSSSSSLSSLSSSATSTQVANKQSESRLDSAKSDPTSLVASLSSAVVTAAAAAAVAAAQNTLSSGDARSLLSGAGSAGSNHHHHGHSHQPRSPGLNSIALKLADAIPEVPYSILHNMKKIDHAAPFYNVPNKMVAAGSAKESLPSMLASALTGTGGAADQLTAMFRSPIWKRLADGYGEFTSEFRSLFRAPPTPMKGPSGSTAKLLRDISVPALLMLLASTIPTDWRPVRTRRKSIPLGGDLTVPSSILSNPDPMSSAPNELSSFSLPPQLLRSPSSGQAGSPAFHTTNPRQLFESGQLSRTSDINLQTSEQAGQQANWINSVHRLAMPSLLGGQNHLIAPAPDTSSGQQAIKRIGDSLPNVSGNPTNYQQQFLKPVNSDRLQFPATTSNQGAKFGITPTGGLFSSLTSGLANIAQSKFMNRLMNANGDHDSYRMMSLTPSHADHKIALARRDHLDDKHRYSLVGVADDLVDKEKLSPPSKPLLSAMTQAVASMFNSAQESGFLRSAKPTGSKTGSLFEVNQIAGDRTINQHSDSASGKQGQPSAGSAEQRELSQLLPQSWKEAVKRTVSSVQQQASTQWRSIEGQVTNWMQDKLKAFPVGAQHSAASSSTNAAPAPVANIIASVSSTAMNILGLGNKNNNAAASSASPVVAGSGANDPLATSSSSTASSSGTSGTATGQKSKNEPNKPAKGALAGVADMIVNTLTNRQISSSQSASLNSKRTSSVDEASSASQHSAQSGPQEAAGAPVADKS